MEKNNKKLSEEEIKRLQKEREEEAERAKILMKADEIKEETFDFNTDDQVELKNELADFASDQIDDPEAKYELYYNVVQKLLKKHLPKGDKYEEARKLIYEEKCTFLTRGHRKDERGIRGADSRMSYIPDIKELIDVIIQWISRKGTMFDLYNDLRNLNISKGYGKE